MPGVNYASDMHWQSLYDGTTFQMEGTDFNKNIRSEEKTERPLLSMQSVCYARDNHIEGLETNHVRHTFV